MDAHDQIVVTLRGLEAYNYVALRSNLHFLAIQATATAAKLHAAVAKLNTLTKPGEK